MQRRPSLVTVRASRSTRRSTISSTRLVDGPPVRRRIARILRDELPGREGLEMSRRRRARGRRSGRRPRRVPSASRWARPESPGTRDTGRVRRRRATSRRESRLRVAHARTSHARRRPFPRRSPRTPRARGARRGARRSRFILDDQDLRAHTNRLAPHPVRTLGPSARDARLSGPSNDRSCAPGGVEPLTF